MSADTRHPPLIYIACPWTSKGGGMFKVADYLIQHQAPSEGAGWAELRPLDTRGSGSAAASLVVLGLALLKLMRAHGQGRLAGVHVNMAERLSLLRKSAVLLTCRTLRVPVVLHIHAAQLPAFYRRLPTWLQAWVRHTLARADCCVVLGEESRRFVTSELALDAARVRVLTNGVPAPTAMRRQPGARQRVLFVGNLSERKGVADLLQALALPGFDTAHTQVCMAGGGDVAGFESQAQALGLQAWVRFEGWADQDRVAQLMATADVLVLPSYDEGLPLVILEALSHGVAVLCTPVGEIPSVLSEGEHALFVPPGDVPVLAAQLQRLLADTPLREHLERQGRALYERMFSMERFFQGVASLHREVFGVYARPGATGPIPSPVVQVPAVRSLAREDTA